MDMHPQIFFIRFTFQFVNRKPLLGVPFTLKDCIEVDGLYCTVGISYRKTVKANRDAIVVKRFTWFL